jgi:hypothetical protein
LGFATAHPKLPGLENYVHLIEERIWNVIFVVLAVVEILVAIALGIVLKSPPSEAKKPEIEYSLGEFSDALSRLRDLGPSLVVHGSKVDNLFVSESRIGNSGTSPIEPGDFHEPFSVQVDAPWKIVAVQARKTGISFDWIKESDTRFIARPALLNPRDNAAFAIFTTNTVLAKPTKADVKEINLKIWSRITNVSELVDADAKFLEEIERFRNIDRRDSLGPFTVMLDSVDIVGVVLLGMLFLAMYVRLFAISNFLVNLRSWSSVGWICGASALSIAAAESTVDLTFSPLFGQGVLNIALLRTGSQEWANYVVLLVHLTGLLALLFLARRVQRKSVDRSGLGKGANA